MKKPSPLILLMGGGALIQVAFLLYRAHAPLWLRYAGMAALIAMGVTSFVLALRMAFEKKPERVKYQSKRSARVELLPEQRAAREKKSAAGSDADQSDSR